LRTQQVLAHESGVTDAVDPLGGSYYVECLTERVEAEAWRYIERIDDLGGAVAAIEAGYQQGEIERAAYEAATGVDRGEQVVVGVNRFVEGGEAVPPGLSLDPERARLQGQRVVDLRKRRDAAGVAAALATVEDTARTDKNVLPPMKDALRVGATLGEVSDALRRVFGEHRPSSPPLAL
jgi:methylmalonyl-CoA mutase N-terminal domain/subunit